jgi:hypothetical protein
MTRSWNDAKLEHEAVWDVAATLSVRAGPEYLWADPRFIPVAERLVFRYRDETGRWPNSDEVEARWPGCLDPNPKLRIVK